VSTARVIPQQLYLRVGITGSTPVTMDRRFIRAIRTTNTTLSGSSQADLDLLVPLHGAGSVPENWPWGLRANDAVSIDAAVTGQPARIGEAQWERIWTGRLDDVPVADAAGQGFHVPLRASTVYKLLEVTTEAPDQFNQRYKETSVLASEFVKRGGRACGIDISIDEGPDIRTGLVQLMGLDAGAQLVNPQYQDWASVIANVAKMAGRELYATESGFVRYAPSGYAEPPTQSIPVERIISATTSLDRDQGLVNRVDVRWGPTANQPSAKAPKRGQEIPDASRPDKLYDRDHYQDRLLILSAPWIRRTEDADWYARWVLSWAMHNTRPAVVAVAFWPEARIGQVVRLAWPRGRDANYYVASVVHDLPIGARGAPVTVLGLTYGRNLDEVWDVERAPSGFGTYQGPEHPGARPEQVKGAHWRTTYYTPTGLSQYTDDPRGPYLRGQSFGQSDGAKLFRDGWQASSSAVFQLFDTRPCAFDPKYRIPELNNVTLSAGDRLRLDSGIVVECRDQIGTDVPQGPLTGRQLDVFYWDTPDPVPPDFQDVQYLKIQNYKGKLPDIAGAPASGETGDKVASRAAGPITEGDGDQFLADIAVNTAATLAGDGTHYNRAPGTTLFGQFAATHGYDLPGSYTAGQLDGNAQCTIFVRYCLTRAGYAAPNFGDGKDAGSLVEKAGYTDVTYRLPLPGDVIYWNPIGPVGSTARNPVNGYGHVAMIVSVQQPNTQNEGGSVVVAQANSYYQTQSFPLFRSGSQWNVGDVQGFGNTWSGIVRPPKQG